MVGVMSRAGVVVVVGCSGHSKGSVISTGKSVRAGTISYVFDARFDSFQPALIVCRRCL